MLELLQGLQQIFTESGALFFLVIILLVAITYVWFDSKSKDAELKELLKEAIEARAKNEKVVENNTQALEKISDTHIKAVAVQERLIVRLDDMLRFKDNGIRG